MSLTRSGSEGVKAATFPASSAVSLARARDSGDAGASTSAGLHPPQGEAAGVSGQPRRRRQRLLRRRLLRCFPLGRARLGAGRAAAGPSATAKKTIRRRRARKRDSVPARDRPDSGRVGDAEAHGSQASRDEGSRGVKAPLTLLRFPAPKSRYGTDEDSEWDPLEDFCPGNFLCVSPKATCVYAYVNTQAARLGQTA